MASAIASGAVSPWSRWGSDLAACGRQWRGRAHERGAPTFCRLRPSRHCTMSRLSRSVPVRQSPRDKVGFALPTRGARGGSSARVEGRAPPAAVHCRPQRMLMSSRGMRRRTSALCPGAHRHPQVRS